MSIKINDNFLGLDPLLTDLLINMLKFNSNERYTIQQIRNHPWVMSSPVNTGMVNSKNVKFSGISFYKNVTFYKKL